MSDSTSSERGPGRLRRMLPVLAAVAVFGFGLYQWLWVWRWRGAEQVAHRYVAAMVRQDTAGLRRTSFDDHAYYRGLGTWPEVLADYRRCLPPMRFRRAVLSFTRAPQLRFELPDGCPRSGQWFDVSVARREGEWRVGSWVFTD